MPKMSSATYGHTLDANLLCGGSIDPTSCFQYKDGNWNQLGITLDPPRAIHVSWKRPGDKVILMGGAWSQNTTIVVVF